MKFKLERFSDLFGTPQQIEVNTLEDLCVLCQHENHKIVFDARDKTIAIWDESIFRYDVDDVEFCE